MEKLTEILQTGLRLHNPDYLNKVSKIQHLVECINANVIMLQARRAVIDSDKYLLGTTYDDEIKLKLNQDIAKTQTEFKLILQDYKKQLQELVAITINEKEI